MSVERFPEPPSDDTPGTGPEPAGHSEANPLLKGSMEVPGTGGNRNCRATGTGVPSEGGDRYRTNPVANNLGPLDGGQIPGGCDTCNVYQTVRIDAPGVWRITIHHDNWCPVLTHNHRKQP